MIPLYEIHPVTVHFPIALLLTGALFKALGLFKKNPALDRASLWLLRLGFLSAVMAAGFGLLAEKTAPHVPPAWETLWLHKRLGLATAGTSIALWIVEEIAHRTSKPWSIWLGRLLWIAVVVLVIATGNEGGELVYTHGMGVATAPHI